MILIREGKDLKTKINRKNRKKRNGMYQTGQKKESSVILLFSSLKNQIKSIALQHTVLYGRQPSKENNMAIVSRVPAFKLKLQQI